MAKRERLLYVGKVIVIKCNEFENCSPSDSDYCPNFVGKIESLTEDTIYVEGCSCTHYYDELYEPTEQEKFLCLTYGTMKLKGD